MMSNYNIMIELEILRMKIHYKLFKLLKDLLITEKCELSVKEMQQLILRYILNKNISTDTLLSIKDKDKMDAVYILGVSELAKRQLFLDVNFYNFPKKMYNLIYNLFEESFVFANNFIEDQIKNNTIKKDDEINIIYKKDKVDKLIYHSDSLNKITDNNIKIYNKKIEINYYAKNVDNLFDAKILKYTFCSLLRYKYLYLDAHGSQLEYKKSIENFKDLNLKDATECFASPFNHTFKHYCSAFPDLELTLGSLGNFFHVKKFPTKILLINPVFDIMFINMTIEYILNYLKKNKHIVYFILPYWKNLNYKILYNSEYFIKKKVFLKGQVFFYNFPTGREYSPCAIEMIMLNNIK